MCKSAMCCLKDCKEQPPAKLEREVCCIVVVFVCFKTEHGRRYIQLQKRMLSIAAVSVIICVVAFANMAVFSVTSAAETVSPWRSQLYPADWTPCYVDSAGRFLQDFSFAGYHSGTKRIPIDFLDPVVDVTQSPYRADHTGTHDATKAIQQAIDDVGRQGGGTVYLGQVLNVV